MKKITFIYIFTCFTTTLFSQSEIKLHTIDAQLLMEGVNYPFLIENYSDSNTYHFEYSGMWFERKRDTIYISAYRDRDTWLKILSIKQADTILINYSNYETIKTPRPTVYYGEFGEYFGKVKSGDTISKQKFLEFPKFSCRIKYLKSEKYNLKFRSYELKVSSNSNSILFGGHGNELSKETIEYIKQLPLNTLIQFEFMFRITEPGGKSRKHAEKYYIVFEE